MNLVDKKAVIFGMYALEIRNISKIFRIYPKPVDRLKEILFRRSFHQEFIALEGVSFPVPIGQTVGIIGDNGAGKSTLLKILAGTLTPTSGEIIKRGRVAALLELGAGFHPEFTGRQNIYLNAALLGLSQQEIRGREKDIIDFAELREFIDRPVKTYSSGMYVRLAFSIATTVDPDILIIDEALSVGDQHFQKKCIDRMITFRKNKTIIFCSHSMYHVNQLCSMALWLDSGRIRMQGTVTDITSAYENYNRNKISVQAQAVSRQTANNAPPIFLREISLNGEKKGVTLNTGDDLLVGLSYESSSQRPFWLAVGIRRNDGLICHAVSMVRDMAKPIHGPGSGTVYLRYNGIPFLHGEYIVNGSVLDEYGLHLYDNKESAPIIINAPSTWEQEIGLLHLNYHWELPAS